MLKVEKVDRICLGVPDLQEGIKTFNKLFGFEFGFVGDVKLPSGDVIQAALSNQGIELVESPGKPVHVRSFHFKVTDLEEAKSWVQENGIKITGEFPMGGMDEAVMDLFGLRGILINYQGDDPVAAVKSKP